MSNIRLSSMGCAQSVVLALVLTITSGTGCGGTAGTGVTGTACTTGVPDASAAPDYDAAKTQSGVWTNRTRGTSASQQLWTAVASDASGDQLIATSTIVIPPKCIVDGFWTSTNGGSTWANSNGPAGLGSIASNSKGTVLIAAESGCGTSGGSLWESTNSGATWDIIPGTSLFNSWAAVASDSTGTRLVAGAYRGDIWTSANSGATWTDQTPSGPAHGQNWVSVASSADGTMLVALAGGGCAVGGPGSSGDIFTSSDSGVTWTDRTPTGPAHSRYWASAASDVSGMNLVAVGSGIWTSADAGFTWTEQTAPSSVSSVDVWVSVASDATGKYLIAATAGWGSGQTGNIFTSANAGVSWSNQTAGTSAAAQDWTGVASDSLGVRLVAVARGGDIWTN